MQFGIRDLLILTSVAALVAIAFLGHRKTNQLDAQLTETRSQFSADRSTVSLLEIYLDDFGPQMDYAKQFRLAAEPAIAEFDSLRQRYSDVEPVPGKVVVRSVPEYDREPNVSMHHWRLSIPTEYPVFLKSAIRENTRAAAASAVDDMAWLTVSQFTESGPFETRLDPGIVDLWLIHSDNGRKIELRLADKQLLQTEFIGESFGNSWSGPSGRKPFARSLTKRPQYLLKIDRGPSKLEFWIWLSGKPDAAGFKPYPESNVSQEDSRNE